MRIFLIGYMGCGKTNFGKYLSKKINFNYIDLDSLFEKKYHISIEKFFAEKDQNEFRKIEHQLLIDTLSYDNVVISTGGGTPCFYDNMEIIKNNGVSIYIKMSTDGLFNRLINSQNKRPLLKKMTKKELKNFIKKQLKEREQYYFQADYTIDGTISKSRNERIVNLIKHNVAQGYKQIIK